MTKKQASESTKDRVLTGIEAEVSKGLMKSLDAGDIESSPNKTGSFRLTNKGSSKAEKLLYTSPNALLLVLKLFIIYFNEKAGMRTFGDVLDAFYKTKPKNVQNGLDKFEVWNILQKKRNTSIPDIIDELNEIDL